MRIDLEQSLMEYGCPDTGCILEDTIANSTLTFSQLRDALIRLGKILFEDTDNSVYVAAIRIGSFGANSAVVAIQQRGSKLNISAFAKEGLIKQNLAEKAITKIKIACHPDEPAKKTTTKTKKCVLYGLVALVLVVVITVGLLFGEIQQTRLATKEYNKAVDAYNEQVELYNSAVELTCIDNISGLPAVLEKLSNESEGFVDNLFVVLGSNDKDIIAADTKTIEDMTAQAKSAVAILNQITVPSGDWVIERLSTVDKITATQSVSKDLDPDGLLGKEGGFSSCIYFTTSYFNPDDVVGESVIAKGTDGGGAVEVYPSVADAEARCEYLAGFDGTVLYSGSYALVGTTVIRTSYKLTNKQQIELTNAITLALTAQ